MQRSLHTGIVRPLQGRQRVWDLDSVGLAFGQRLRLFTLFPYRGTKDGEISDCGLRIESSASVVVSLIFVVLRVLRGFLLPTDGEIDHLVYALYGLTEAEIGIVEGSCKLHVTNW